MVIFLKSKLQKCLKDIVFTRFIPKTYTFFVPTFIFLECKGSNKNDQFIQNPLEINILQVALLHINFFRCV